MPAIDVLSVGCPICGAESGKCCTEPQTARSTRVHTDRVRHAVTVSLYPKTQTHEGVHP